MRIADIVRQAETAVAKVNSKDITLQELTDAEVDAVFDALPRPVAPLRMDSARAAQYEAMTGRPAQPEPDENDPEHVRAVRAWNSKVARVQLAVAMRLEAGAGTKYPGPGDAFKPWALLADADLGTMPERDIVEILRTFRGIGTKDITGNSSSPPAA